MDSKFNKEYVNLITQSTGTLGLLTYQISRETFGRQTDHILRAAYEQEYQVVMSMAAHRRPLAPLDDQTMQIKELLSRGIDGLLIHTRGDGEESERILQTIQGRVPVVTFHDPTQMSGIVLDDTAGFYEATEHLIQLGHERIGFIGSEWNQNHIGSAKANGYLLAMQKHGLTPQRMSGKITTTESGYLLGKRLGDGLFTALVCRNDYTAIGLCRGLREVGIRVPDDVAVVGSGNIEVASYVTPALTTLATPYEAIAEAAMELMLEQLEGEETPRQVTLKPTLVVRESCGANSRKE